MKIAVIACGWHYPSQFYDQMSSQILPAGWEKELFVVGHRDPIHSHNEKILSTDNENLLSVLDCILYKKKVTKEYLEDIGWRYIEGVSGCEWQSANTWLSLYDYSKYDCLLFCGDDALIVNQSLIYDVLSGNCKLLDNINKNGVWVSADTQNVNDWLVISNSRQPRGLAIRGSFEFFKPEVFKHIGGIFDLSKITLNRAGEIHTPSNYEALTDWNNHLAPFIHKMTELGLYDKIKYMSNSYRVSDYIIECERGYLSNMHTLSNAYLSKIQSLYQEGKLNEILKEYVEYK
jgi:hypothetical protein